MNHQLAMLMTPRVPLALIAVRLPVNSMGTVSNNVAFTPLALVFRHIRTINTESTQSLMYINQSGDSVFIAPRIYLTLKWAEKSQSIVNPHLSFTQQMQLNDELPQTFSPNQKQHFLKKNQQLTFRKQTLSSQAHTFDALTLPSVAAKKSLPEIASFTQQDPSTNHALSLLSSIVAIRYLMSRNRINDHSNRYTHAVMMPVVALIDKLKYKNYHQDYKLFTRPGNTESVSVKFNLLRSVVGYVVEFTRQWKTAQSIISLLIRQQKTINKTSSFSQFSGRVGKLLSDDNNSFSRRITRSSMKFSRHRYNKCINDRHITTNTKHILRYSGGLFTQSVRRTYQQATSPVAVDTKALKLATDISNASGNIRSLNKQLQQKNQSVQRQENRNYQRLLTQADVIYRSNKALATTPRVTVPIEPAPIPVATPQIDIDRLSTDVWRQLEKRIRIERERHGRL